MGKQKADSLTENEEKKQSVSKTAKSLAGAAIIADGVETGGWPPDDAEEAVESGNSEAPLSDVGHLLKRIKEGSRAGASDTVCDRACERAGIAARNIERNDWQWNSQYGDLLPEIALRLDRFASVRLIIFLEGADDPRVLGDDDPGRSCEIVLFRSGGRNAQHYYRKTPDDTPGDGNCFYHAFLHAFYGVAPTSVQVLDLKREVAAYIRLHRQEVGEYLYDDTPRSGGTDRTTIEDIGDETVYPEPDADAEELLFDQYRSPPGKAGRFKLNQQASAAQTSGGRSSPAPAARPAKGILKSPPSYFSESRKTTSSTVFIRFPARQRNNIRLAMLKAEGRRTRSRINAATGRDEKSAYAFHLQKIAGEYVSLAIRKALSDARYMRDYHQNCLAHLLAARQAWSEKKTLAEVQQHSLDLRLHLAKEKQSRSKERVASYLSHLIATRERIRILRRKYGVWHDTSAGKPEWVPDIPQQRVRQLNEEIASLRALAPADMQQVRFEADEEDGSWRQVRRGEYEEVPDLSRKEVGKIIDSEIATRLKWVTEWQNRVFAAQLAFEKDCNDKASHHRLKLLLVTAAQLMTQEKIIRPGGDPDILALLNEASAWHKASEARDSTDWSVSPDEKADLHRTHGLLKAWDVSYQAADDETRADMDNNIRELGWRAFFGSQLSGSGRGIADDGISSGGENATTTAFVAEKAGVTAAEAVRVINDFHASETMQASQSISASLFSERRADAPEESARSDKKRKKIEMQPMVPVVLGFGLGHVMANLPALEVHPAAPPQMDGELNLAAEAVNAAAVNNEADAPLLEMAARGHVPAGDAAAAAQEGLVGMPLIGRAEQGLAGVPLVAQGGGPRGDRRGQGRHAGSILLSVLFAVMGFAAAAALFARFLYGWFGESSSKKEALHDADETESNVTSESVIASSEGSVSTTQMPVTSDATNGTTSDAANTTASSPEQLPHAGHNPDYDMQADDPGGDDHRTSNQVDDLTDSRRHELVRRRLLHEYRVQNLRPADAGQWGVVEGDGEAVAFLSRLKTDNYYFSSDVNQVVFVSQKPHYREVYIYLWRMHGENGMDNRDFDFYELWKEGYTIRFHDPVEGQHSTTIKITISKEGETDCTFIVIADHDSVFRLISNFNFAERNQVDISRTAIGFGNWENYKKTHTTPGGGTIPARPDVSGNSTIPVEPDGSGGGNDEERDDSDLSGLTGMLTTIVHRRILHQYRAAQLPEATRQQWGTIESNDDEADNTISRVSGKNFSFKDSPYQLLTIEDKPSENLVFIDLSAPEADESGITRLPAIDFSPALAKGCRIDYVAPEVEDTGKNERFRIAKDGEPDSYFVLNGEVRDIERIIGDWGFELAYRQDLASKLTDADAQSYKNMLESQVEDIWLSETKGNQVTLSKNNQVFHFDVIPYSTTFTIHTPKLAGNAPDKRSADFSYFPNQDYISSHDIAQLSETRNCQMTLVFRKAEVQDITVKLPVIHCTVADQIWQDIVAEETKVRERKREEAEEEEERFVDEIRTAAERNERETQLLNSKLTEENVNNATAPVIIDMPSDVPVNINIPDYKTLPPQKIIVRLNHKRSTVIFSSSTKGFFEIMMTELSDLGADPADDRRVVDIRNMRPYNSYQSSLIPSRNTADPTSKKYFSRETTDFHLDVRNEVISNVPQNFGHIDAQIIEMERFAFDAYQSDQTLFADASFDTNKYVNTTYPVTGRLISNINSLGESDYFDFKGLRENVTISIIDGLDNPQNRKADLSMKIRLVPVLGTSWIESDSKKFYVKKFRNEFTGAILDIRTGDVNVMQADERNKAMAAVNSFTEKLQYLASHTETRLRQFVDLLSLRTGVKLTNAEKLQGKRLWNGLPVWAQRRALKYHAYIRNEDAAERTEDGKKFINFKVIRDGIILRNNGVMLDKKENYNWAEFPANPPRGSRALFRINIIPDERGDLAEHNHPGYVKAVPYRTAVNYKKQIQGTLHSVFIRDRLPDNYFGVSVTIEPAIENWINLAYSERIKWTIVTDHFEEVADELDTDYPEDAITIRTLLRRMNGDFTGLLMTPSYPVTIIDTIPQIIIRDAFYQKYNQSVDIVGGHEERRQLIRDILKFGDKPRRTPDSKPGDQGGNRGEWSEDKPENKPVAEGGDKPENKPAAEGGDKPEDKPVAEGGDKPEDKPVAEGGDKPEDKPVAEGGDKPEDKPIAGGDNTPGNKPVEGDDNLPGNRPVEGDGVKPDKKPVKETDEDDESEESSDYEAVQWLLAILKFIGGTLVVGGIIYAADKLRTALNEVSRLLRVLGAGAGYLLIPSGGAAGTTAGSAAVAASGVLNVGRAYGYPVTKEMFRKALFVEISGCATLVVFLGDSAWSDAEKAFDDPQMKTALDALAKALAEAGVIASCMAGGAGMTSASEFGFIHRRLSYEEFLASTTRKAGIAGGGLTAASGATDIVKCLMGYCFSVINGTNTDATAQSPARPPNNTLPNNTVPEFVLGVIESEWAKKHPEEADGIKSVRVRTLKPEVARETEQKAEDSFWKSIWESLKKSFSVMERNPPG